MGFGWAGFCRMGYANARLHCAVCCFQCFLVEKKAVDMCVYIFIMVGSTWSHVEGVEKNASPTTRQTQKNIAKPKSNRPQLLSCGNFETAVPT